MSQVIANLLTNAAKYTPSGGRIKLSATADNGRAVITIRDNGIGIPAEMQSDVFRLFAQIGDHRERSQGGLGIGLALVKQLVELHGGSVSASSEGADQGSVFTVQIPLTAAPDEITPAEQSAEPAANTSRRLKVLVIDDNPIIADTMGMLLEDIGHEFEAVHNGRGALDAARNYRPDAILLDIGLPDMDGYEVCRALRHDHLFEHTTIIAQTGWGQDKDKELAKEAGFDFHLTKPVPLADLQRILSDVLPRE
ncbi:ATP-binding protein [Rhizobium wenxiniae]|uniref:ATP-binding protein n=1 Tax=Rhizobium wenxiniae TaxID=1737357 RepID=UPI003C28595E